MKPWGAWLLSDYMQHIVDTTFISPLQNMTINWPALLRSIFVGSYGLFSLGIYSFIWAFPVVLLVGLSLSVTEDSGLKERITTSLDPWLLNIGLSGQDLIPVLSSFGCNVVAVFQSRSCSRCTRHACISMITFGSACSYQTGATLSLFNAAHHPWLFAPYLGLLFVTGAIHTKLWNRSISPGERQDLTGLTWLQWPRWRNIKWMLKNIIRQFLVQAMPLFLLICFVAGILDYTGITRWLSETVAPVLHIFKLPPERMPGIIFSLLQKDGLSESGWRKRAAVPEHATAFITGLDLVHADGMSCHSIDSRTGNKLAVCSGNYREAGIELTDGSSDFIRTIYQWNIIVMPKNYRQRYQCIKKEYAISVTQAFISHRLTVLKYPKNQ